MLNLVLMAALAFMFHRRALAIERENARLNQPDHYYATKQSIYDLLPIDSNDIVFAGNSITDMADWAELLGQTDIKNRGINGDTIVGLTKRCSGILKGQPRKLFLLIGTNDLYRGHSLEQIIQDYEALLILVKQLAPNTQVYVQSILPTYQNPKRKNTDIIQINTALKALALRYQYTYVPLFELFVDPQTGELDKQYSYDGTHINGKAYEKWRTVLKGYIL
jgi:lysophospholipase L1-like esterase